MGMNVVYYVIFAAGLAYEAWFLYALFSRSMSKTRKTMAERLASLPKLNMQFSIALGLLPFVLQIAFALSFSVSVPVTAGSAPVAILIIYTLPSVLLYLALNARGVQRFVPVRQKPSASC